MSTVKVTTHAVVEVDGVPYGTGEGSLHQTRSVTAASGLVFNQVYSVAPVTAVKLFDVAENLDDFDFLLLECDLDVLLEFVTNTAATFFRLPLGGSGTANTYGVPLILDGDDTQYGGTVSVFDGTADTIEQVWAYNADSSDTARVHVLAAT